MGQATETCASVCAVSLIVFQHSVTSWYIVIQYRQIVWSVQSQPAVNQRWKHLFHMGGGLKMDGPRRGGRGPVCVNKGLYRALVGLNHISSDLPGRRASCGGMRQHTPTCASSACWKQSGWDYWGIIPSQCLKWCYHIQPTRVSEWCCWT